MSSEKIFIKRAYTSDQPGLILIVVACLLALVLGLSFRAYFSPRRIEAQIHSVLKNHTPGLDVEFGSAQLLLSQGLWPRLSLEIKGLKIRKQPACGEGWGVQVDTLVVPFRVSSLLSKRLRMGVIEADHLALRPDRFDGACHSIVPAIVPAIAPASPHLTGARATAAPLAAPLVGGATTAPPKTDLPVKQFLSPGQIAQAGAWMDGFTIHEAQIFFEHDSKLVNLKSLQTRFDDLKVILHSEGSLQIPASLTLDEELPTFEVKFDLHPELLNLEASGRFSEGFLNGELKTNPLGESTLNIKATNIPLSQFAMFLEKAHLLPKLQIQPRFLWLSCQANVAGPLAQLFRKNPLEIQNCEVEGDVGQLQILHAKRHADGIWEPFHLGILKLDIREVFKAFNKEGPRGILTNFGVLKGDLDFQSRTEQTFVGTLTGLEFLFSNGGVPAKQAIDGLQLKASRSKTAAGSLVTGEISNLLIKNGATKGQLSFHFNEGFQDGQLQIHLPELTLDPAVQKLMTFGVFSSLSVESELDFADHQLKTAHGDLKALRYAGDFLNLEKLQAHFQFSDHHFEIQSKAETGRLPLSSSWYQWLAPTLTEASPQPQETLNLQNLHFGLQVEDSNVQWTDFEAHLPVQKMKFSSRGAYEMQGPLTGQLQVMGVGLAPRLWSLTGTAQKPQLAPQAN